MIMSQSAAEKRVAMNQAWSASMPPCANHQLICSHIDMGFAHTKHALHAAYVVCSMYVLCREREAAGGKDGGSL